MMNNNLRHLNLFKHVGSKGYQSYLIVSKYKYRKLPHYEQNINKRYLFLSIHIKIIINREKCTCYTLHSYLKIDHSGSMKINWIVGTICLYSTSNLNIKRTTPVLRVYSGINIGLVKIWLRHPTIGLSFVNHRPFYTFLHQIMYE